MRVRHPAALTAVLVLAEVLGMAGVAAFPALQPTFIAEWRLSNTAAGWINSVYYAGYVVAVLVLTTLTDRVDPRRVYLASVTLTFAATLAFALAAEGLWTALLLRLLAGIGLAGMYMPGLKALSDLVEGPGQSRAVAFYTAGFSVGASGSYLLAGEVAAALDWRWAFAAAAAVSATAIPLVWALVPPVTPAAQGRRGGQLADLLDVLRNRRTMGYVLAYSAHAWELFAMRAWIVTYLVYSLRYQPQSPWWSPTALAAVVNLMTVPASVSGNELSRRFGRRRVITAIMLTSALLACGVGFAAPLGHTALALLMLLYGVTVTGDSASITAGAVGEAPADKRGATMAVHSAVGFAGAFVGPLAVGGVLDVAGGGGRPLAWGLAFAAMGAGAALGPVALGLLHRGGARAA